MERSTEVSTNGTDAEASPRLALRVIDESRARHLVSRTRPEEDIWAPDYPTPGDVEAAAHLLGLLRSKVGFGVFGTYEMVASPPGTVVGGIGFHWPLERDGSAEIGYSVAPSCRNRGYATAALEEIVEVARSAGVPRVIARALPDNVASRRVMEKAGFSFVDLVGGYVRYEIDFRGSNQ